MKDMVSVNDYIEFRVAPALLSFLKYIMSYVSKTNLPK